MSEAEARQAARLRRDRDSRPAGQTPSKSAPETPGASAKEPAKRDESTSTETGDAKSTDDPASEQSFVDPQLKRAVDYLEEQLRARGIPRIAGATGGSANPTELAYRFSPVSNAARVGEHIAQVRNFE